MHKVKFSYRFLVLFLTVCFFSLSQNSHASFQQSFADMVEKTLPSVVLVKTKDEVEISLDMLINPNRVLEGTGSGFIISEEGYIVTNYHVIKDFDQISVRLYEDQLEYPAKIIGVDASTDLAVIKIDKGEKLPSVKFGDSDKMRVGDPVLAIGNPLGFGYTVTSGIISAKTRYLQGVGLEDFIQTDAPLNFGNSGGPILNTKGEVIAVATAISTPNGGNIGLGFGVPSNVAKNIANQLKDGGHVKRGWIGVMLQPVNKNVATGFGLKEVTGVLIGDVIEDGPGEKAGIKPGDIILEYNGKIIDNQHDLIREVKSTDPKTTVQLKIWRGRKELSLSLTIGERPVNINDTGIENADTESAFGVQFEVTNEGLKVVQIRPTSVFAPFIAPSHIIHSAKLPNGDIKDIRSIEDFKFAVKAAKESEEKLLILIINGDGQTNFYQVIKLDE